MSQEIDLHNLSQQLRAKNQTRKRTLKAQSEIEFTSVKIRNDIFPKLQLEELPIKDISPSNRTLRKLDRSHVQETIRSIQSLGFCSPILIGKEHMLIDGAVRLEACRQLGLLTVPCIVLEHLSKDEQRVLRLAINRLGEKGEWDLRELKLEFEELIALDAPIDISGFSFDEIDHIALDAEVGQIEVGSLEPQANSDPSAVIGNVYQLGPHRLICGDATDPNTFEILMAEMPKNSVRMVLTDEPYNVRISGHVTGGDHREFAMASGELSDTEFQDFNNRWMSACLPYIMDGGLLATFIDWRGLVHVHGAASSLGLSQLNLIVWSKTNGGMGSLYRSQHELFPVFKKGSASHVNNVKLGKRGRYRTNVWTYPGASSLGSDARRGLKQHPTVKPSAMLEDALLDVTNRGDLILDPFLGSGSTLIAAHKTGRICFGVELDPQYVDVIIKRFHELTGETAILLNPNRVPRENDASSAEESRVQV